MEPAVLRRARVPARGASLAEHAAATRSAGVGGRARETRGGRTCSAAAKCRPEQVRGGWRFGVGDRRPAERVPWARRVVTQRTPSSARGVRPAGLLRASARLAANAGILLQRCLPGGHASGAGPRAQVFGPQDESRPTQASAGVCGHSEEAAGAGAAEPRCVTGRSDRPRRCGRRNRGRRLWAGSTVGSTFSTIFGGCRA